jgi:hypothetical protein
MRQLLPNHVFEHEKSDTYLFGICIRVVTNVSYCRNARLGKTSEIRLELISPCLIKADVHDFGLLKITINSFALDKLFHLFDLTSLERCNMLRDFPAMSFEDTSRS